MKVILRLVTNRYGAKNLERKTATAFATANPDNADAIAAELTTKLGKKTAKVDVSFGVAENLPHYESVEQMREASAADRLAAERQVKRDALKSIPKKQRELLGLPSHDADDATIDAMQFGAAKTPAPAAADETEEAFDEHAADVATK